MIYDCFVFYDELDLLEIRLNTLKDVVDKFVLVESKKTFRGIDKPLFYAENRQRFSEFNSRIIHIVVEDFPKINWRKLRPFSNWDREDYQRDEMKRGLVDCQPGDVIMISDVDEIPEPQKVKEYSDKPGIKTFYQELYYYYLNYLAYQHTEPNKPYKDYIPWHGTVMADFSYFKKYSPNDLRTLRSKKDKVQTMVMDGGWHLSFMGGTQMILKKMKAYSHTEYMTEDMFKPEWVESQVRTGKDIFNRPMAFKRVSIDRLPAYIQAHQDKFAHLLLKE
ncbi:glycosyltransferase family 17 protein [Bdellovibrio reynosensis]|uniref:N-acetylglucosaminyltransferase n=1 Tax=Bdellovibrio reynosensis TaxID=2835041 RepID=A0ABY4CFE6_9BACT|nr:N-acetylglucosaminyltransferase [Bdellovibrio reynosensis]UOF02263.1 N-acetylglucosaminyltransferase [Bdellovibrio reynosensis]